MTDSMPSQGDKMDIQEWSIDRPIAYARNPRVIPERAVDKLAASLREFGFRQPLVVDEVGVIVVGHTRLLAAKKLGLETVPVHVVSGWSEAKKRGYRLADNRVGQESSWDAELLGIELNDLGDFDLSLTGFDPAELTKLKQNGDARAAMTEPQLGVMEYRVIVDCDDEAHQGRLLERFGAEGLTCHALIS